MSVNIFTEAKASRKEGEKWQDAIKRVSAERHASGNVSTKTHSECHGLKQDECVNACHWTTESKPYKTKTGKKVVRKAHCAEKGFRYHTASSIDEALSKTYPQY